MSATVHQPLVPPQHGLQHQAACVSFLQHSYRDGDGAPALVPEHCSQQLANVNLPDSHSGVGASRQQQFSTACE